MQVRACKPPSFYMQGYRIRLRLTLVMTIVVDTAYETILKADDLKTGALF